ncbi:MAG: hypothetical protein Q8O72_14675 [Bacteroidales bacterium]|nr:hypothetical protein [Bacteroidales bacterium]
MNTYLQIGTSIVIFALISYSIGIITEQRINRINRRVITFLTLGVLLDITATTFMIIGSDKGGFTLHGFIGYSSLLGMLVDAILMWTRIAKSGIGAEVPQKLHLYSRYAYIWWVLAFITGGLLVAF